MNLIREVLRGSKLQNNTRVQDPVMQYRTGTVTKLLGIIWGNINSLSVEIAIKMWIFPDIY